MRDIEDMRQEGIDALRCQGSEKSIIYL